LKVDPEKAVALYQKAAEMGNLQAKIDLAFLEFHGNAGIVANHDAAIEKMSELGKHSSHASKLVEQWTNPPTAPIVEVPIDTPVAAPVEVVEAPATNIEYKAAVNPDTNDIDLTVDESDMTFVLGERILIQRPALPMQPVLQ
jgi:TPR repeat protein